MTLAQIKMGRGSISIRVDIIPGAEKKIRWNIPEDSAIPPITTHKAIHLMNMLEVINEGGRPNGLRHRSRLSIPDRLWVYHGQDYKLWEETDRECT